MRRRVVLCTVAVVALLGASSTATTIGAGFGFEPTGLLIISALTETPITESLELRAEAGIATDEIAGLMLATGTILYHYPLPPIDPFAGVGVGVAMTPPPFSTGVVLEATGGVRIVPLEPLALFAQVRYLVRWSGAGITTGPVYEAGIQFRF